MQPLDTPLWRQRVQVNASRIGNRSEGPALLHGAMRRLADCDLLPVMEAYQPTFLAYRWVQRRHIATPMHGTFTINAHWTKGYGDPVAVQHRASIIMVISAGAAKITAARSPIIPAGMIAGAPLSGPSLLESVMNRKLRSQKARVLPSAVVTR
jgi:hypothetical protein